MKIKIKSEDMKRPLTLWLPYNIMTCRLACKIITKNSGLSLSPSHLHKFLKAIKKDLRPFKPLTLVSIHSNDQTEVKITI